MGVQFRADDAHDRVLYRARRSGYGLSGLPRTCQVAFRARALAVLCREVLRRPGGFLFAGLSRAGAPGRGDEVRDRAAPHQPSFLHGNTLLAAERLLAGQFVVHDRLLRAPQTGPLQRPAGLCSRAGRCRPNGRFAAGLSGQRSRDADRGGDARRPAALLHR